MPGIFNKRYKEDFRKTPYSKRAIFLPQCLRSRNCPAKTTNEGIKCVACGKCSIHKVKKLAEKLGYRFFIVPGASLVKKLVKKHKPKGVIGVACNPELNESLKAAPGFGVAPQCIALLKDGCVNTKVDWDKVRKTIELKV
ncbi:DUF116 domain-containing protein [Candidatus Woesearchaeota archaeon]|nr:DUF116 domain-containing protein [Candidatus Woesearchaeota archaeon]